MDGNRDEGQRCIDLAKRSILNNDSEKAIKYLTKAQRLYPTDEAKEILETLEDLRRRHSRPENNHKNPTNDESEPPPEPTEFASASGQRSRSNSSGRNEKTNSNNFSHSRPGNSAAAHHDYTEEQVTAVKQIKKCKDYYEILGVTKETVDSDVKKQYRKLALQFHPDKNKAPGASEAFKMIGNAFAILSDIEKRKQYDMYGTEEQQRKRNSHSHHYDNGYYDYSRGFEGDISADEIFNMFFGGGFPSGNVYVRRQNRYRETHRHQHQNQEVASGYNVLLQMMPVLVLLCLSLMSTFFVSDPTYSLSRTQKYQYERKTSNLEVPYFVKENFEKENKGSIRRIEQQVEEDYVSNLRASCFRERNYKESMIWRARNFRDKDLEDRAKSLKTPSCDHLHKISQQYVLW